MNKVDGVNIGLTICYDLRFPNLYRQLAKKGAQIILIPAAFTVPTGKAHWETLIRARVYRKFSFYSSYKHVWNTSFRKKNIWSFNFI